MPEHAGRTFHDELVATGLIVPVGVPGVFGRGAVFEDVLARVDAFIVRAASADSVESMTFPPVIPRNVIERTGYMDSFPDLCGVVHSFMGDERSARAISKRMDAKEPWGDLLGMTDVVLNPAACYPFYPTCAGVLPENGRNVTLFAWVYRHEPSPEPTRLQSFRVREYIRAATPDVVVAWRDMWQERGAALLRSLGLSARVAVASDPFFGRAGKMLAAGQLDQRLKFEVLVPVISEESPDAVCSFNYHQDKFGLAFGIRTRNGATAHTACVGFGLERVAMAMFSAHGFAPDAWPVDVRARLWP
ncbi:MAG TPA: amino acid--[acyl-carrier-protein] ligase [Gemmatimonadaceae bacterium]|nr:amino acid--[acyl-carrier-protein] ligase [Gemmatimonadaceae bacterium]